MSFPIEEGRGRQLTGCLHFHTKGISIIDVEMAFSAGAVVGPRREPPEFFLNIPAARDGRSSDWRGGP